MAGAEDSWSHDLPSQQQNEQDLGLNCKSQGLTHVFSNKSLSPKDSTIFQTSISSWGPTVAYGRHFTFKPQHYALADYCLII